MLIAPKCKVNISMLNHILMCLVGRTLLKVVVPLAVSCQVKNWDYTLLQGHRFTENLRTQCSWYIYFHLSADEKLFDCQAVFDAGTTKSGVYSIHLKNGSEQRVYCDMEGDEGWLVSYGDTDTAIVTKAKQNIAHNQNEILLCQDGHPYTKQICHNFVTETLVTIDSAITFRRSLVHVSVDIYERRGQRGL